MNILVTGAGGPAGVNALRLLSKIPSIQAYGTDMDPLSAGRIFAKEFDLCAPCRDVSAYRTSLEVLIERWKIDVVLPTVAEELILIREALEGLPVTMVLSDQVCLEVCHEKAKLYQAVTEAFPEFMTQWQWAHEPAAWDADTYFLKPSVGRGARGCRLITKAERQELVDKPDGQLIMEPLPGREWTVDAYIDQNNKPVFIVPRERLQLSGGICSKGRTEHHAELIEKTAQVLSLWNMWGPICVQWKEDQRGDFKLLEINPRLSGAVMITAAAGADPMRCLVEELTNETISPVEWNDVTVIRYFTEHIL